LDPGKGATQSSLELRQFRMKTDGLIERGGLGRWQFAKEPGGDLEFQEFLGRQILGEVGIRNHGRRPDRWRSSAMALRA
jgi:hypothetical protein